MHKLKNNNTLIDHDNNSRFLNPSFSSTLLDQIYRSIDQGDITKSPEMKFYRQRTTTEKKQKQNHKWTGTTTTTTMDNNKRRDNKVSDKVAVGVVGTGKLDRRRRSRDYDQDVMFFSSASFSSDSSSSSFSGGLSSSDTESLSGTRSRASSSCLPPLRPKPVRTSMSFRYDEEQGRDRRFHSFRHDSNPKLGVSIGDEDEALLIKSKSRALKIYNNLKKVKQPISPGGKITSFLNSIFASSKKTRSTFENTNNTISATTKSCPSKHDRLHGSEDAIVSYKDAKNGERKAKSDQASACSSASSFSRSCLSKTNSCDRDKLYNGVKRTVRFYPVSVVVGEDCRPCGHKRVCEEEGKVPIASKSPTKNNVVEKRRVVEEAAREFLEKYHRNNKKNDLVFKDLNLPISTKINANDDDDDDDDDVASCASSDLFELDHLAVFGNDRYCEELPVYETTHVSTNRAIANGLIV